MPNAVYDDQRQAGSPIRPDSGNGDLDKLNQMIPPEEQDQIENDAAANHVEDQRVSKAADNIRAQERAAQTGNLSSSSSPGGATAAAAAAGAGASSSAGGTAAAGAALAQQEEGAAAAGAAAAAKNSGGGWKSLSLRKRAVISGSAALLIFGAGGASTFSVLQGPLQLIHVTELLGKFHFNSKNGQSESRAIKAMRYAKNYANKTQYKNRMGFLGNAIADRLETKLKAAGIDTITDGNRLGGWTLDPEKLRGIDFDSLGDKSPEGIAKYLKDSYNIDAIPGADGKLTVSGENLSYTQERQLLRSTMKLAGFNSVTGALSARLTGVRYLFGFHRFQRLERKVNDAIENQFKEWKKQLREYIRQGVKPIGAKTDVKPEDKKVTSDAESAKGTTDEILDEVSKAQTGLDNEDPNATAKLKSAVGKALSSKTANVIGLVCLAFYVTNNIDKLNQQNVVTPMIRMAMDGISKGSETEAGQGMTEFEAGFQTRLLFDDTKGSESSWSDAMSIKHELGQPLTGKDIPQEARIDQSGNPFTRFIDALPGKDVIQDVCDLASTTAGTVVILGALTLASATPFTAAIRAIGTGVILSLLADGLAKYLAAAAVSELSRGVDRGNYMNFGARLAARDQALASGGLPISEEEHNAQKYAEAKIDEDDFKHQSLAYRLFSPEDSQSFLAQVIDRQLPDPRANFARAATNLLDVGHNLSSLASLPFNKIAYAAGGDGYDYGFPDYSYTTDEMNDSKYADPFKNADAASDILDKNEKDYPIARNPNVDNYVYRAKKCFGVVLEKKAAFGQPAQWTVTPPVPGSETNPIPTQKDVLNTDNKCINDSKTKEDFDKIRFFIFDSNTMNALACYESTGDDPDPEVRKALTQSCIDIGLEANPVPPTGLAGGSAGTGTSGSSNTPGKLNLTDWKLTLPVCDGKSAKEVTQPELATYNDEWYHPATDGSGQEFYVDSTNACTTSGSNNPRSELREMTQGGKQEASWTSAGPARMLIREKVTELGPPGGKQTVVIGQIHDKSDDITVFRLEKDQLWITKGNDTHGGTNLGTVKLGQIITVGFDVSGDVVHYYFSPTGETNPPEISYNYPVKFSGGYFKAGNYYQGGKDGGKSRTVIMGLAVTHDGSMPNIAGAADVASGAGTAATNAGGQNTTNAPTSAQSQNTANAVGQGNNKASTAPAPATSSNPALDGLGAGAGQAATRPTLPDGTIDLRPSPSAGQ